MKWCITYYNENIEEDILALPATLLARYLRMSELMQSSGPHIGMPHTRAMGNGLFELRLKGKEGIARIFYCTLISWDICMLHGFIKKQQKTPSKELALARLRMKEIKACLVKHTLN